jgi:N-succinyldiaminopimelate aminotransferase
MVAHRFAHFGQSVFAEYTALANAHGAINLSQGFPDFAGPRRAIEAGIEALRAGHVQYAPMTGLPVLRSAIVENFASRTGMRYDANDEVTVTCGCSEAIMCAYVGLLNPGDEIIIFQPFFDFYSAGAAFAGATPRFVTLRTPKTEREAFTFDPQELERAFTNKTRAIIINTPHNPTGKVFSRAELESIAGLCIRHNVTCISDEVYEHLIYTDEPHVSIATLPGMRERTITLSSLGKSFSLTGWKVGWALAPAKLSACVRAAHQFNTFSGATPMQHAAATVLKECADHPRMLRELFVRNRDALCAALRDAGLTPLRSDSTYFVMADHTKVSARLGIAGDRAFCEYLTKRVGVAAIPPSVFYGQPELGKPLARFAYCKKAETIDEACRRLRDAVQ